MLDPGMAGAPRLPEDTRKRVSRFLARYAENEIEQVTFKLVLADSPDKFTSVSVASAQNQPFHQEQLVYCL